MTLAATITHPAGHTATYHLVSWAVVISIVAVALLLVLFCIYWLFKAWEEEERVAEMRRREQERTETRNGAHGVTRPTSHKS